jgi:hypothetical protein
MTDILNKKSASIRGIEHGLTWQRQKTIDLRGMTQRTIPESDLEFLEGFIESE